MSKLPTGILLAAGRGKRFGSNKLRYPLAENKTMLMMSLESLTRVLEQTIVVISPELIPYIAEIEQPGVRVVVNEQAEAGMGTSLACGVKASQEATGWLIALADMPYIKAETIGLLADRLEQDDGIIAPEYKNRRGHPVGFAQSYMDALVALTGDMGARQIITNDSSHLKLVPVNDEGVVIDIDAKADLY